MYIYTYTHIFYMYLTNYFYLSSYEKPKHLALNPGLSPLTYEMIDLKLLYLFISQN